MLSLKIHVYIYIFIKKKIKQKFTHSYLECLSVFTCSYSYIIVVQYSNPYPYFSEKSKDPQRISIYSLKDCKNVLKVHKYTMCEFWPINTSIRINNHCDKSETPHPEDIIRKHIAHAEKRKLKWHNSEHFTYWCRYAQVDLTRSKHVSIR